MRYSRKPVGFEFTDPEIRVFFALKKMNVIFTTQYPYEVEPRKKYYFDFCISRLDYPSLKYKLIDIEVDSELHDVNKDDERDRLLKERDVYVIRINDKDFKSVSEIIDYLKPKLIKLGIPL